MSVLKSWRLQGTCGCHVGSCDEVPARNGEVLALNWIWPAGTSDRTSATAIIFTGLTIIDSFTGVVPTSAPIPRTGVAFQFRPQSFQPSEKRDPLLPELPVRMPSGSGPFSPRIATRVLFRLVSQAACERAAGQ